jgi:hypothetical protein
MSILGAAASAAELFDKLKNYAESWSKEKKVKIQVVDFLEDDAVSYWRIFEKTSALAPSQLIPLLNEIKETPSKSQIDSVVSMATQVQTNVSGLIQCFIALAKDCSQISINEAFMNDLRVSDGMLYDFVRRMEAAYSNGNVKIGDEYFGFFKLYRNELLKKYDKVEAEKEAKKGQKYLLEIKKKIVPYLNTNIVSRQRKKDFFKSFEVYVKASKRFQVKKSPDINFSDYVIPELAPIITLFQEILAESEKRLRLQKYQRLHPIKE